MRKLATGIIPAITAGISVFIYLGNFSSVSSASYIGLLVVAGVGAAVGLAINRSLFGQ